MVLFAFPTFNGITKVMYGVLGRILRQVITPRKLITFEGVEFTLDVLVRAPVVI